MANNGQTTPNSILMGSNDYNNLGELNSKTMMDDMSHGSYAPTFAYNLNNELNYHNNKNIQSASSPNRNIDDETLVPAEYYEHPPLSNYRHYGGENYHCVVVNY